MAITNFGNRKRTLSKPLLDFSIRHANPNVAYLTQYADRHARDDRDYVAHFRDEHDRDYTDAHGYATLFIQSIPGLL